jgi:hypothetical protein
MVIHRRWGCEFACYSLPDGMVLVNEVARRHDQSMAAVLSMDASVFLGLNSKQEVNLLSRSSNSACIHTLMHHEIGIDESLFELDTHYLVVGSVTKAVKKVYRVRDGNAA